ncbi:MAG: ABC transporter ATP-binding protein [Planctomycetes bacterium]|nr:ABC transporter ATP-binding protein [Planctomycetota bacterium]
MSNRSDNPAITVDHVSRKFSRGDKRQPLRGAIDRWFKRDVMSTHDDLKAHEFYAIEDLNFHVAHGEALAIIGPNGAGKSTTLKLLAGIMPPTRGTLRTSGRVSALIEVGAGFHPDLTGRENIYLNASVLGLSRTETRRKFSDIVDFAGIEPFLDTPLKRYSSGMYARLGFSVAVHTEPEVLLVDEVLSVGDRVFRAKCMDRMRSFLRKGVAIIFVSHDLTAVMGFCDRAVVLDKGRTTFTGSAIDAVSHYHHACTPLDSDIAHERIRVQLRRRDGRTALSFDSRERVSIECDVPYVKSADALFLRIIRLRDQQLALQTCATPGDSNGIEQAGPSGRSIRFDVTLNIPPAEYGLQVALAPSTIDRNAMSWRTATKFMMRGSSTGGGIVEVSPTFAVTAM